MFAKILKLLLAGIVAILVPDDNPIPPPWYSDTQEAAAELTQFTDFLSNSRSENKTGLDGTAAKSGGVKQ